jgi:hypothetical protein
VKCSWVKFKMRRSEVSTSVVKCSEDLSNRVSNIIRRYIDHMKFAAWWLFRLRYSFIFFWLHSLSFYMYSYCYVFLLLCTFCYYVMCCFVSLSIIVTYILLCVFCLIMLFCVLFVCKCVLYYCHRDIGALVNYPNWGFSVLCPQL